MYCSTRMLSVVLVLWHTLYGATKIHAAAVQITIIISYTIYSRFCTPPPTKLYMTNIFNAFDEKKRVEINWYARYMSVDWLGRVSSLLFAFTPSHRRWRLGEELFPNAKNQKAFTIFAGSTARMDLLLLYVLHSIAGSFFFSGQIYRNHYTVATCIRCVKETERE